jgi:hypothetical protein
MMRGRRMHSAVECFTQKLHIDMPICNPKGHTLQECNKCIQGNNFTVEGCGG